MTEPVLSGWSTSLGGVEIAGTEGDVQTDPTPESQTDPNRADTDGGGSLDGAEEAAGTDPLDPDDDPPGDGSGEGSGSEGSARVRGVKAPGGLGVKGSGEGSGSEGSGGVPGEGSGEGSGSEGSGEARESLVRSDLNDPLSGLDPNGGLGPGSVAAPAWPPADEAPGAKAPAKARGPGPGEGTGDPSRLRPRSGPKARCSAAARPRRCAGLAGVLIVLATRRRRAGGDVAGAGALLGHAARDSLRAGGVEAQNLQLTANRRSDYIVGQSGQTQAPRTATSAVFHHVDDPVVLRIAARVRPRSSTRSSPRS